MSEWWGQHGEALAWTLVGIAAGVAVSWYFFRLQKRKKTLDWQTLINAPLVNSVAKIDQELLRVEVGGHVLTDPRVMIVRIINTGREAVRAEDFDQPITLEFNPEQLPREDRSTLIVGVCGSSDHGVEPEIATKAPESRTGGQTLAFEPKLLNSGDWFDIQLLVDSACDYPAVRARFADQTRPMKRIEQRGGNEELTTEHLNEVMNRFARVSRYILAVMWICIAVLLIALVISGSLN